MTKLRQFIVISVITITSAISLSAYAAANLIAIIAADTTDSSIGFSVNADFDRMRQEMQTVANYTDLNLKEILIKGKSTTPSNLIKQLDAIKANADDVIVFYFSGHGFRTEQKGTSPWPNLFFSRTFEGVEYEYVMHKLLDKNPRLLITIADVCNSFWGDEAPPRMIPRSIKMPTKEEKVIANFKHLFVEDAGMINITSSTISETTWGDESGGKFTIAFIDNLTKETESTKTASWNNLLKKTATEVTKATTLPHSYVKPQHPYYELNNKYPN